MVGQEAAHRKDLGDADDRIRRQEDLHLSPAHGGFFPLREPEQQGGDDYGDGADQDRAQIANSGGARLKAQQRTRLGEAIVLRSGSFDK